MDEKHERANKALRGGTVPKLTIESPVVQSPQTRALNAFLRRSIGRAELEALEGREERGRGES